MGRVCIVFFENSNSTFINYILLGYELNWDVLKTNKPYIAFNSTRRLDIKKQKKEQVVHGWCTQTLQNSIINEKQI